MSSGVRAVIFDVGGVLLDWDPRHLYRKLFDDEAAMERFLSEVCPPEWNARFDAGESMPDGVRAHARQRPEHAPLIQAWWERWEEMVAGEIPGSVEILAELRRRGVPVHALSNWAAETYPIARRRYDFLSWFEHIVISGNVGLAKPDPRIFEHLLECTGMSPEEALFVDDSAVNTEAAARLGFAVHRFRGAEALRGELARHGLLPRTGARR